MRRELVFLPELSRDFSEVWNYYEELSPGRGGERFEAAYRDVLQQIKSGVISHRISFGNFHRVFIARYPYVLYYKVVTEERAVIVGLLYARFDPERTKQILAHRK